MTREEAIEVIEQDIPCEHDTDLIEALDMAISALNSLEEVYAKGYNDGFTQAEINFENDKALSQEPCDAVSREAVIEWLENATYEDISYAVGTELSFLPPVTQKSIECDDTISRKDAEEMFRNIRSHLKPQDYKSAEEFNTRDLMLLNAEQMIHALPSVTQKSGKWILNKEKSHFFDVYECSNCAKISGLTNYCPNCGTKMIEPQERSGEE